MHSFQTLVYKVVLTNFELGWDYSGDILFESAIYSNPTEAMLEFSFCEPSHPNWFATMRMMENNQVVEEEIFDTSVMDVEYVYLDPW